MLSRLLGFLRSQPFGRPARSEKQWERVARQIESAFAESSSDKELAQALSPILALHGGKAANLPLRAVSARSLTPRSNSDGASTSRSGDSALFAAINLNLPRVFSLLEPKADFSSVDRLGKTLLARAVQAGNISFTKALLRGSDLSARSSYGSGIFESALLSLEKGLTQKGSFARLALFAVLAKESAKKPPPEAQALLLSAFTQLNRFLTDSHWAGASGDADKIVRESGLLKLFGKLIPAHCDLEAFLTLKDPSALFRQALFPQWEARILERQTLEAKPGEPREGEPSANSSPDCSPRLFEEPVATPPARAPRSTRRL